MNNTKEELNATLEEEAFRVLKKRVTVKITKRISVKFNKRFLLSLHRLFSIVSEEDYLISLFLLFYRKYEYYYNNKRLLTLPLRYYYGFRYAKLSKKLLLYIPINTLGRGIKLFHTYKTQTIICGKIGRNVIIRPGVVLAKLGNWQDDVDYPTVEDNVEFSFDVKAFGPIKIGRRAIINAGSVLLNNVPPYAIVCGNPGKVVGFTKTPAQIIEFERINYPENQRIPFEVLERNYQLFFLDRLDYIHTFIH